MCHLGGGMVFLGGWFVFGSVVALILNRLQDLGQGTPLHFIFLFLWNQPDKNYHKLASKYEYTLSTHLL